VIVAVTEAVNGVERVLEVVFVLVLVSGDAAGVPENPRPE